MSIMINQKLCEEKKIRLQSMSNAKTCIDRRFTVTNSGLSCQSSLADIQKLSNEFSHISLTLMQCKPVGPVYQPIAHLCAKSGALDSSNDKNWCLEILDLDAAGASSTGTFSTDRPVNFFSLSIAF